MRNLFFFILILFSCTEHEKSITPIVGQRNYADFNGFYFFEKGMTLNEFKSELEKRKINYRKIPLDASGDLLFYPCKYGFLLSISDLLKYNNPIQIFEVYNLTILDKTFPVIQIGFVNNKILYLVYESNTKGSYNQITEESGGDVKSHFIIEHDLDLIKTISNGWEKKYGLPYIRVGNLNGFYPSSEPISHRNDDKSGVKYFEYTVWLNKDSSMNIFFQNVCSRDTFFSNKEIVTNSYTTFSVLFDKDEARSINDYNAKVENQRQVLERKKHDSIENIESINLHKQIDSL
jgi:hypothetical protein